MNAIVMPPSRIPGSNVIRLRKLRTNKNAPTSSTSDTAIWVTTIRRCTEKRSRPPVSPRPPAFIAAAGSVFVARSAGTAPKKAQVKAASPAAKRSTRQSVSTARRTDPLSVESDQTKTRLKNWAR